MRTNTGKFALSAAAAATVLALSMCLPAQAALLDVDRTQVAPANPLWYQDAIGLKLQPCTDGGLNDPCAFIGDPQYWSATALYIAGAQRARLVLSVGVAPAANLPPDPTGLVNEIFIRLDGFFPGTYTVTHPFGVSTVIVDASGRGILDNFVGGNDPLLALSGPVSNFLYFADGVPLTAAAFPGAFYLGGGELLPGPVFGSPHGTNYLRIEGPGLPPGGVQVNDFQIVGKVFVPAPAAAPRAMHDFAGTKPSTAVTVDARANDLPLVPTAAPTPANQVALNPASIAPSVGVTKVPFKEKMLLSFTPTATPGLQTFTYSIKDFTGAVSNTATVGVFVEDMQFASATYRPRTGKWSMAGAGTIRDLTLVSGTDTAFFTDLSGGQEVPMNASAGYGKTTITLRNDATLGPVIDYSLTFAGLTAVTQAHLHGGAIGVNGAPHLFLCTNLTPPAGLPPPPACPAAGGTVAGTLSAADFVAGGLVTTFADLNAAVAAGNTYVNVHTQAYPSGEIRGQVGRNVVTLRAGADGPMIGAAKVQADGSWYFAGKVNLSPGAVTAVQATSAVGNMATRDLQKR